MQSPDEAVLLVTCPDRLGIVARLAAALHEEGANILDAAQYTDANSGTFLQRVHISGSASTCDPECLESKLAPLIDEFELGVHIRNTSATHRVAIFVSKEDHCLHDLLLLQRDGDLHCKIAFVISNHPDLEEIAQQYHVPFHYIPVTKSCDEVAEAKQSALLEEHNIDVIVLARYMRVLSPRFTTQYQHQIINIHHSFLPAFAGGKPYHQAHTKGVKLIGATAHYATSELDAGPIIEQGIIRVSHKDAVSDMIRKGRDIERTVLARAVRWHLEHRIIVHANRAIIFE